MARVSNSVSWSARRVWVACAALVALVATGCLPDESNKFTTFPFDPSEFADTFGDTAPADDDDDDDDDDATDTGDDDDDATVTDDDDATGTDDDDDDATDTGDDDDDVTGPCEYPQDCGNGDCVAGACVSLQRFTTSCNPDATESECEAGEGCDRVTRRCVPECELDIKRPCKKAPRTCRTSKDCPLFMSCHATLDDPTVLRCINNCDTDLDCPADGICTNGECIPFANPLEGGNEPTLLGSTTQMKAGVGESFPDFPWGISLAGYGLRGSGVDSPYQKQLGGSNKMWDRLNIRAVAVDNGEELAIFVRFPLIFSTDYLVARTAQILKERDGVDYSKHIITGATHSHSQPARYWTVAPDFGFVGHDVFEPTIFEVLAKATADAIEQALDDRKDAKYGIAVFDDFDPDDRITSNRRETWPFGKDPQSFIIRVDDAATNKPMAALTSFAMHGTIFGDGPVITGDSGAGIEIEGQEYFAARYGVPVNVTFFNGNAGNVSPRGEGVGDSEYARAQAVGQRYWKNVGDAFDATPMSASLTKFEVALRREAVSYDIIGYDRDKPEFYRAGPNPFVGATRNLPNYYGGLNCCSDDGDSDPTTRACNDGQLGCLIDPLGIFRHPLPEFGKVVFAAVRMDNHVIMTMPGESTSTLGEGLRDQFATEAAKMGMSEVIPLNIGYSMTHFLYILEEEDWFQGTYESQQNVWGFKLGDFFRGLALELGLSVLTEEKEDFSNNVKPEWYPAPTRVARVLLATPANDAGKIKSDVPASVARGGYASFSWTGGDPGADMPRLKLQRKNGANFETVKRADGTDFDDRAFETMIEYQGDWRIKRDENDKPLVDPVSGENVWETLDLSWGAEIEFPWDLPVGTYRIVVDGEYVTNATTEATTAYQVVTREFTLGAAELQFFDLEVSASQVTVSANYPDAPTNDDGVTAFTSLRRKGYWLRTDGTIVDYNGAARTWADVAGPRLSGAVTVSYAPADDLGDTTNVTSGALTPARGLNRTLVTSRDAGGTEGTAGLENLETATLEFEMTGADAGDYVVTVTDAFGNTGTFNVTLAK